MRLGALLLLAGVGSCARVMAPPVSPSEPVAATAPQPADSSLQPAENEAPAVAAPRTASLPDVEPDPATEMQVAADAGGSEPLPASPPVERPRFGADVAKRILAAQSIVNERAAVHAVSSDLVNAVIWVESKFDTRARGPAGALGLMQIMPKTGRSLAKRLERKYAPYDPEFNVDAGAYYLKRLLRRFDGDERLALAAYNRGVGRVAEWQRAGEPLPESTERYVSRVFEARAWLPGTIAELEAEPRELPPVAAR